MNKFVIIVAGGKGLRMGGELPKQFIPLSGKPILMHTLERFYSWDDSAQIILVLPKDHQPYWKMLCQEIGCKVPHQIVNGGETRFHSVSNGLEFIKNEKDSLIAIHDGVRPFVSIEVIEKCFQLAQEKGTAIPTLPMIDSVREITTQGSKPVDRNKFLTVQTPQVFRSSIIKKAYQQHYNSQFTDDASVVEANNNSIYTVEGNRENIKITTPFDIIIAHGLLS